MRALVIHRKVPDKRSHNLGVLGPRLRSVTCEDST